MSDTGPQSGEAFHRERFFRRAALFPLVSFAIAGVVTLTGRSQSLPAWLSNVVIFCSMVFYAGINATIPYAIFLTAVWHFARPRSVRSAHMIVWLAPPIIAIPYATVYAIAAGISGGWNAFWSAAYFWMLASLVVGYFYAISIEGAFVASAWWMRRTA